MPRGDADPGLPSQPPETTPEHSVEPTRTLVAGASAGIGRAICATFAAPCVELVVVARGPLRAADVVTGRLLGR